MVFKFGTVGVAVDDVITAIVFSLYQALRRLNTAEGNEDSEVPSESFSVKSDCFDLEVASDLYAPERSFRLWHLRVILTTIFRMSETFTLRECTFEYLNQNDQLLFSGHLKNPSIPIPARRAAPDPYIEIETGVEHEFRAYGRSMDFEVVAAAVLDIFGFGWTQMVRLRRSSSVLQVQGNPWTYLSPVLELKVQRTDRTSLYLNQILSIGITVASFGRVFFLREMFLDFEYDGGPSLHGELRRHTVLPFTYTKATWELD